MLLDWNPTAQRNDQRQSIIILVKRRWLCDCSVKILYVYNMMRVGWLRSLAWKIKMATRPCNDSRLRWAIRPWCRTNSFVVMSWWWQRQGQHCETDPAKTSLHPQHPLYIKNSYNHTYTLDTIIFNYENISWIPFEFNSDITFEENISRMKIALTHNKWPALKIAQDERIHLHDATLIENLYFFVIVIFINSHLCKYT